MKLFVKKTLNGLIPSSRTDFDQLQEAKLKLNEYYEVEIKKVRNILFHRKYFILLKLGFENQNICKKFDDFRAYVIVKSGYYQEIFDNGEVYKIPNSISFSSMDQIEFEKLYSASVDVIIGILGCEKDELIQEVINLL